MAGPGDNLRANPKGPVDSEPFKRAVTACMRAIAGDHELEVGFSNDKPALTGHRARLPDLLHGVKLTIMAGAMELKADSLQSELWPAMVIATMAFLCAEMLLATSRALLPKRPSFPPIPRSAPQTPAASR